MPHDPELTPEFFQQLSDLEERPDIVVEKLQLSPADLLRFKSVSDFSPDENEAYKALLRAAIRKRSQEAGLRRKEASSEVVFQTIRSVGAVGRVVIGGLWQFGRSFAKKQRRYVHDYSTSTHTKAPKVPTEHFKERERERGFSHDY